MLLLLFACHFLKQYDCVREEREVGDDDALGDLDFTLGELVADLAGTRTFPATVASGAVAAAELVLARAEDPAVFHDASWEEHTELMPGIFADYNMMYVECDDRLTVPFTVDLATSDGSADLAGELDAVTHGWGNTIQGVGGVSMFGRVEAGTILPDTDGPGREVVVYFDGPELIRLEVGTEAEADIQFPPVAR